MIRFNYISPDPSSNIIAQNGACLIETRERQAAVILPWMNTRRHVCIAEDLRGNIFMLFVNYFTWIMIALNDIYFESVILQK